MLIRSDDSNLRICGQFVNIKSLNTVEKRMSIKIASIYSYNSMVQTVIDASHFHDDFTALNMNSGSNIDTLLPLNAMSTYIIHVWVGELNNEQVLRFGLEGDAR